MRTDRRDQPLTLEPLEAYMLADGDERYPRTFVIGLEFSGELHREAFQTALSEALANEPLLTATVKRRGIRGHVWQPSATPVAVEWLEDGACPPAALDARRIDLRCEPGLRVIAVQSKRGPRIFHVFHHACSDGIGALAMLGRLYAAYSRKVRPGALADAAPVRAESIRDRSPAEDLPQRFGSRRDACRVSGRRAWDVLTTRTARLVPTIDPDGTATPWEPIPFPGSVTHVLDTDQTRQLKRAARRGCGTLNNLLLCAMFQTLRDWNAASDPGANDAWYQIMVPVDLRSPKHDQLPAASLVSCVFVKQHGTVCDDPERLLRAVIARMQFAVSSRSALIMYNSIRMLTRLPGLLRLVLRAWRTQATAVVSYVSDAGRALQAVFPKRRGRLVIGNLVLEQITATGPVRPGTAANLTAGTYAGKLVLNLTLDPHQFTARDGAAMMRTMVDNLLELTGAQRQRQIDEAVPCEESALLQ
jgi:hypothetical protein